MNVMLDPLMVLNLTPVHGGLVIVLGDDPGGYGSQNDQDTRPLATLLEMPMLEPSTPAEAFRMMVEAFDLSERFQTPIILRETRSFAQSSGAGRAPRGILRAPGSGTGPRALAVRPRSGATSWRSTGRCTTGSGRSPRGRRRRRISGRRDRATSA